MVVMSQPLRNDPSIESEDDSMNRVVDAAEIGAIRDAVSDEDKEHAFCAYYGEDGRLTREGAKKFLGDEDLKTAEENAEGAERLFEGDSSRFLE